MTLPQMPYGTSMASQIARSSRDALNNMFDQYGRQDDEQQIIDAVELNELLIDAQSTVAKLRRQAVRSMRARGHTLKDIGEATGMSHQRVSQIERGWSARLRTERKI